MNKEYLAIFDLDGTLFDTRDVNYFSYKEALAKHNVELDRDFFVNTCNGRHYKSFLPKLIKEWSVIEEVHNDKKELYKTNLYKAKKNIHLFNLIDLMKSKYNLALVTTASKQNTLDILNYFKVKDLFDLIITQEDVIHKKPDPEGFLKAIEYFKVDKEKVIVFEDSPSGIIPAKKIGVSVFVVEQF